MVLISKIIIMTVNVLNSNQIADDEPYFVITGESESVQHFSVQQ